MSNWRSIALGPRASVREAVKVIDAGALQIALIVDDDDRLLGTLTDGDVRRGILAGYSLECEVAGLMNTRPLSVGPTDDRSAVLALMKQRRIHQIPVLDGVGRVVGIESIDELLQPARLDNIVVLMAGGLGTRLRPLTADCPKPMLKIGDAPILETILLSFVEQGFHRFRISVNYMADRIKRHFGDGSKWNVEIEYLEEDKPLGTAGALRLLQSIPDEPIFVMNGDILARINFRAMLDFHRIHGATATMGVRQFSHTIPYGVVTLDEHRLLGIVEKPESRVFVSSGIYLLSPSVLQAIPDGTFYDIPKLFQQLLSDGEPVSGFPVHEYWIDIGRMEDLERARTDLEVLGHG